MKKQTLVITILLITFQYVKGQTCGLTQVTHSQYTSGFLPRWGATNSCIQNSVIQESSSNIGIGATPTNGKLDVSGNISVTSGNGFKIGSSTILSIGFGGTFVGDAVPATASTDNTIMGYRAGGGTGNGSDGCTAIGYYSGNVLTGLADYNTFLGWRSGAINTNGSDNVFIGVSAGALNINGNKNTATGYQALSTCTVDNNNAFGYQALSFAGTGTPNSAFGTSSSYSLTTGINNNSFGFETLNKNVSGNYNSAFGDQALFNNTASNNNAHGYQALYSNTTGTPNTAFGTSASYSITIGTNNNSFGFQTLNKNVSGNYNCAFGDQALFNNTANYNCSFGHQALFTNTSSAATNAFGYKALYANTSGGNNNAFGYLALTANTTGSANTAMGHGALTTNTAGANNTAFGYEALLLLNGDNNTAIGHIALLNSSTGHHNTATGSGSMYTNTTGYDNTAFGTTSLYANVSGHNNTAAGYSAGITNTTGHYNTYIGNGADGSGTAYSNSTALGSGAAVNASDKVRIGDATVTVIEGNPLNYTSSDARFKFNINENVKGLEFINKLRPVSYQFNTQQFTEFLCQNMADSIRDSHLNGIDFSPSTALVHSGLLAQEVEQAAIATGFVTDIVHAPANENDNYSIAYAGLVVPLIKAVQEQQSIIDSLKEKNTKQDSINNALQDQINQIVNNCCNGTGQRTNQNSGSNNIAGIDVQLSDKNAVVLNNAVPNPFAEQTVIGYNIPENAGFAQIIFYNNLGQLIKAVDIKTKGRGQLNVFANDLTNGVYSYSLIIDGKLIDTKKLIKTQ
ncbi:MAG: tail fiber domain-containing protein [Bacteroidia bacterium]